MVRCWASAAQPAPAATVAPAAAAAVAALAVARRRRRWRCALGWNCRLPPCGADAVVGRGRQAGAPWPARRGARCRVWLGALRCVSVPIADKYARRRRLLHSGRRVETHAAAAATRGRGRCVPTRALRSRTAHSYLFCLRSTTLRRTAATPPAGPSMHALRPLNKGSNTRQENSRLRRSAASDKKDESATKSTRPSSSRFPHGIRFSVRAGRRRPATLGLSDLDCARAIFLGGRRVAFASNFRQNFSPPTSPQAPSASRPLQARPFPVRAGSSARVSAGRASRATSRRRCVRCAARARAGLVLLRADGALPSRPTSAEVAALLPPRRRHARRAARRRRSRRGRCCTVPAWTTLKRMGSSLRAEQEANG